MQTNENLGVKRASVQTLASPDSVKSESNRLKKNALLAVTLVGHNKDLIELEAGIRRGLAAGA
jgi:hypothetical protein